MTNLITDILVIKDAMDKIIKADSVLSLDKEDFGGLSGIIGYQKLILSNPGEMLNYQIEEKIALQTKKVIINISYKENVTIQALGNIISEVKELYEEELPIILGTIVDKTCNAVEVDVFLSNQ